MGRIEKEKNLVKFWVDGKAKPYILDINKGELIGLRGAALVTIPLCYQASSTIPPIRPLFCDY